MTKRPKDVKAMSDAQLNRLIKRLSPEDAQRLLQKVIDTTEAHQAKVQATPLGGRRRKTPFERWINTNVPGVSVAPLNLRSLAEMAATLVLEAEERSKPTTKQKKT